MTSIAFTIREAGPDDAEELARLIHQLAGYEKLSHESNPDPKALRKHLDPVSNPRCDALLAIERETGRAIGFALFFPNYSTFLTKFGLYLEDLFVEPAFRKAGIGRALFQRVIEIALERGCERVEWSVLNWNELAIQFYRDHGATYMDEWTTMRLSGIALRDFA